MLKIFIFLYILSGVNAKIDSLILEKTNFIHFENNIINYTKWMRNSLPLKNEQGNHIKCVDLVVIHSKINRQQKQRERILLNMLIKSLSSIIEIAVCQRNEFKKFLNINYVPCDILILMDFNEEDDIIFSNIRKFSVMNKSVKYLLVLLPYNLIFEGIFKQTNPTLPTDWPTDIFIHAEVIVVINFTIYHLQTPFKNGRRSLQLIKEGHYRDWTELKKVENFNGRHLRVLTLNCDTHNYWNYQYGVEEMVCKTDIKTKCVKPEGIESVILSILSENMNFSYSMSGPATGLFGFMQLDGTMDGIVGEVGSGLADLFYCGIWVLYYRHKLVDFSHSFLQRCVTFLVPRPTILSYSWYSIFLGFSIEIWISFVGMIFLNFLFLIFLKKLSKNWANQNEKTSEPQKVVMDLIRIMTTGDSMPEYNIPGSIPILSSWALFCVFIINFYSCDLVSFLTIPRFTPRIDTTEDFVKANLTWELVIQLPNFNFLNLNKESDRIIKERFSVQTDLHTRINNILSGKYAVFAHKIDNHVVIIEGDNKTPVSHLRIMKTCVDSPFIAYGYPHNSPYKKSMETKLRIIFESGIIQFISEKEIRKDFSSIWDSVTKENDFKEDNTPEVLTVDHIYGAFIVLMFGHILALFTFCIEKGYERFCLKNLTKHSI